MARHRPRRGSLGFSPRKRSVRPLPRIRSYIEGPKTPALAGFAGYKVGMTHAFIVDYRKRSTTAGQEVSVPVTVVEVPPLRAVAARLYRREPYGTRVVAELWSDSPPAELERRLPAHGASSPEAKAHFDQATADEVRVLVCTQPRLITGVPTKTPQVFEVRVTGEKFAERRAFAAKLVGQ
ncbi:MAG: 50S ribosomal protein L3, partial [Thermoplasmata archaeon]|nr:50S ribosomal protein L3 [Thermoplasmata archaeon]